MHYDFIRQVLRDVCSKKVWLIAENGMKPNSKPKKPYSVTLNNWHWNSPNAGCTFEDALTYYNAHKDLCMGVGICLDKALGITVIDLDYCINDNGEYSDMAQFVTATAPEGTYIERSSSGHGLHICVYGVPHKNIASVDVGDSFDGVQGKKEKVEIFHHGKFVILTGDIPDCVNVESIKEGQEFLDALQQRLEELKPLPKKDKPVKESSSVFIDEREYLATGEYVEDKDGRKLAIYDIPDGETVLLDGYEYTADTLPMLIDSKIKGDIGEKWQSLYHTGVKLSEDDSVNDYALAQLLCYWTKGQASLIKEIMRNSVLYRDKYNRDDYLERTIKKAVAVWCAGEMNYYGKPRHRTKAEENRKKYKDVYPYLNSKGLPFAGDTDNMTVMLANNDISVRFDKMHYIPQITGCGLDSYDFTTQLTLLKDLSVRGGLTGVLPTVRANIKAIAWRNAYNPACDYLLDCLKKYRATPSKGAIDRLLSRFTFTNPKDIAFYRVMLIKFLLGSVAMAFNDGRNSQDFILVIHGGQGCGKTTFVKSLVPSKFREGNPYEMWVRTGKTLDPRDKDSVQDCLNAWIVELGEFGATLKYTNALKQFLTSSNVDYRTAYAPEHTQRHINTTFIATVNDDNFLNDPTGNRRFFVLGVESIDNGLDSSVGNMPPMSDDDLMELWGEVMAIAEEHKDSNGLYNGHRLNSEEIKALQQRNIPYEKINDEGQMLIDLFDWSAKIESWTAKTVSDIAGLLMAKGHHVKLNRLGIALKTLERNGNYKGLQQKTVHGNKYWITPTLKEIYSFPSDLDLPYSRTE